MDAAKKTYLDGCVTKFPSKDYKNLFSFFETFFKQTLSKR